MMGMRKPHTAALVTIPTYAVGLLKRGLLSMSTELISSDNPPKCVFTNQPVPLKSAISASPAAKYWFFAVSVVASA